VPSLLAEAFASLLIGCLRALSRRGRRTVAHTLAMAVYALGIRRRVTLSNLRLAYPELPEAQRREIARGAYRTIAFSLLEALASEAYTDEELARVVDATDWMKVEPSLTPGGKGVLIATAHFGSWEVLGEVMCRRGYPISVVAKPLKGAINARVVAARTAAGVTLIAPRGSVQTCSEAVERGSVVCMLIDQSIAASRGLFVPFFGQLAATTPALSVVARRTGAPVFVVMAHWEGDALVMAVDGPFPVPHTGDESADLLAHTATVTAAIEQRIRAHPEQWLWLHRRWKERPLDPANPNPRAA